MSGYAPCDVCGEMPAHPIHGRVARPLEPDRLAPAPTHEYVSVVFRDFADYWEPIPPHLLARLDEGG